jgi:hypothetical protein
MQMDYPGSIFPFAEVQSGTFFAHFAGGTLGLAMKIHIAATPETIAVLSFTQRLHPTIPAPTVLDTSVFDNREVLALKEVALRPDIKLEAIMDGSPPLKDQFVGAVILIKGSAYIRALYKTTLLDINLATGAARTAVTHPGSMWINDWEIVLAGRGAETVLCSRDKPATPPG